MRRHSVIWAMLAACMLSAMGGTANAADIYPWRNHDGGFSFVFGNDIDTHQQTRRARNGSLFGFFYIQFTGTVTRDRYPVATHVDCNSAGADCKVGWKIDAKPSSGKLVLEPTHDHPVFLIGRADIPQPGSYAHFH